MTGDVYIHPTADVSPEAAIGPGTRVWHQAQIRERVEIGAECIIGKGAYLDFGVHIGARVKIQNGVFVYHGATIDDGVFLGPGAMVLNDRAPRAVNPDGSLKTDADWEVGPVHIQYGASVGGGAIVLPGVNVGRFALVGAGAVVSRRVPDHALVVGTPARQVGWVCRCARTLAAQGGHWYCPHCDAWYTPDAGGLRPLDGASVNPSE